MAVVIVLALATLVVVLDQLTKAWAVNALSSGATMQFIPGLLNFSYVENRGAAFGLFQNFRWVFVVISVIFIVAVLYVLIKKQVKNKIVIISVSLILGGTIGNLIDRVVNGYVVDFLSLTFFSPVCNVADYCLTIGVVILIIYFILEIAKESKIKKEKD